MIPLLSTAELIIQLYFMDMDVLMIDLFKQTIFECHESCLLMMQSEYVYVETGAAALTCMI